mmetsp:Transcript_103494/g.288162  ORF Transcript_103494/g.288162 Transcript_103494/m.288162 type:complete len:249 (-) Transcript_103494:416-1162(-)
MAPPAQVRATARALVFAVCGAKMAMPCQQVQPRGRAPGSRREAVPVLSQRGAARGAGLARLCAAGAEGRQASAAASAKGRRAVAASAGGRAGQLDGQGPAGHQCAAPAPRCTEFTVGVHNGPALDGSGAHGHEGQGVYGQREVHHAGGAGGRREALRLRPRPEQQLVLAVAAVAVAHGEEQRTAPEPSYLHHAVRVAPERRWVASLRTIEDQHLGTSACAGGSPTGATALPRCQVATARRERATDQGP